MACVPGVRGPPWPCYSAIWPGYSAIWSSSNRFKGLIGIVEPLPRRPRRFVLLILIRRHLGLADNLLLHIGGHQVVVAEFHGVRALALGDAAQLGGIARDLGQRSFRLDDGQVAGQAVLI